MPQITFDNSFSRLPDSFYTRISPTPVKHPTLLLFNQALADTLGLALETENNDALGLFSGNQLIAGAEPLATVYAGHQFGGFSPQLGDGRAILLGEVLSPTGIRYDIQLKGAGRTPYSRGGDGRSALGPVLREYLVSEAMATLGIPTTRALAAVSTGEEVARDRLVPGGILTRVAQGFVRVGSFEYFASKRDLPAIKQLADYVIQRHYPEIEACDHPYAELLKRVVKRQAKLIAQWMQIGFIHGVMNTDNMSITGETIDYGPCAFMDAFSQTKVFSSIDHAGRYAYHKQPDIGQWNLIRLAESLLPLIGEGDAAVSLAQDILSEYGQTYNQHWSLGMKKKIGLSATDKHHQTEAAELVNELLTLMEESHADFTLSFYHLSRALKETHQSAFKALFSQGDGIHQWWVTWQKMIKNQKGGWLQAEHIMQTVNPVYIPRNHHIEAVISAAEDHHDFTPFYALNTLLQTPFEEQKGKEHYLLPPLDDEIVHQTFCGT